MTCSIAYSSNTGNTKLLAETIKATILTDEVVYCGPLDDKALKADRIFLGFWTNNSTCDNDTQKFIAKLTKQQIILFGTAGLGYSADYFDKIIQRTRLLFPENARFFASFMCQGKMPIIARNRLIELRNKAPLDPKLNRMVANFDIGQSHPDKNDLRNLVIWLRKL